MPGRLPQQSDCDPANESMAWAYASAHPMNKNNGQDALEA